MNGKDCINPSEQLKKWHVNLIQCFRKEYAKLSEEEQKQILMKHNYNPSCQIEIFWLNNPNWQIIVTTHFEDRRDLEVVVNGPYNSNIFLEEAEKILSQPRWNKPLYKNSKNLDSNLPSHYGEFIAQWLRGFIEAAKNATFMNYKTAINFSRQATLENGSIEQFYGDKRSFSYEKLAKNMIADVKYQLESSKKLRPVPKRQPESPKSCKGCGTYFLPPVIIGKLPKLTISDRLYGTTSRHRPMLDGKLFVKLFGKTPVIITDDGFVGVCTSNHELAIKVLNTMMATFEIKGLEAKAVREHELSEIDYDPETLNIIGFSYDLDTIRNKFFHDYPKEAIPEYTFRKMKVESIKNIIEAASKTFEDSDMTKITVDFGDMLAHSKDSEFSQAFIIGWTIIEKHISQKYKDKVKSKRLFSVDKMLKNLKPTMPEQDYDTFMSFKSIRNKYLHGDGQITKRQAQNMSDAVKNYVLKISR